MGFVLGGGGGCESIPCDVGVRDLVVEWRPRRRTARSGGGASSGVHVVEGEIGWWCVEWRTRRRKVVIGGCVEWRTRRRKARVVVVPAKAHG